jgi:hypothetical protein
VLTIPHSVLLIKDCLDSFEYSVFGSACYIEDSFPSMLYMAYKYAGEELSLVDLVNESLMIGKKKEHKILILTLQSSFGGSHGLCLSLT